MRKWAITALLLGIFSFYVLIYTAHLDRYLTLEQFNAHRELLQEFVASNLLVAATVFIVLYTMVVACAIPTGGLITVAGGYFFGIGPGTVYAIMGATLGAVLAFLIARYLMRDVIERRYGSRVVRLNSALHDNGVSYLLVLRLVPFMPFFLINLLVGLTRVPLMRFVWTTAVGIFPATFLLAFAGRELTEIHELSDLWSANMLAALCALALLALVPVLVQRLPRIYRR